MHFPQIVTALPGAEEVISRAFSMQAAASKMSSLSHPGLHRRPETAPPGNASALALQPPVFGQFAYLLDLILQRSHVILDII